MRLPRVSQPLLTLGILLGYTVLLLTFVSCISPAVTSPLAAPTPVVVPDISDQQGKLLRRSQAQRLAAQAELELSDNRLRVQDAPLDLPLLLAREAVLTTWEIDGYVTTEADRTLRALLLQASDEPTLSSITQQFATSSLFSVTHDSVSILAIAITPDGHTLAVATNQDGMGMDNPLWLWDTANQRLLGELKGLPVYGIPAVLAFSPDNQTLLFASDSVATLWDWRTRQQLLAIPAPAGAAYYTGSFSPDGRMIVLAGKDVFILVDATTGELLHRLVAPNKEGEFNGWFGPIRKALFDPTGTLLLTNTANENLRLWDIASERQIAQFGESMDSAYPPVAFSHDGRFIVTTNSYHVVQIWEVATQKLLREFSAFQAGHPSLSRDDQYLFVGSTLYDFATGTSVRHFTDHIGNSAYAFFAQDDETIVVVAGTTVEIVPTLDRMLAYADALIQREPPTFTEWELRRFELGGTGIQIHLQTVAAEPLNASATPPVLLTPRPRPEQSILSPLPTPRP